MSSAAEQPDPVDFRYDAELAGRIEEKWQDRWQQAETFAAPNPVGPLAEVPRGVRAQDLELDLDDTRPGAAVPVLLGKLLNTLANDRNVK